MKMKELSPAQRDVLRKKVLGYAFFQVCMCVCVFVGCLCGVCLCGVSLWCVCLCGVSLWCVFVVCLCGMSVCACFVLCVFVSVSHCSLGFADTCVGSEAVESQGCLVWKLSVEQCKVSRWPDCDVSRTRRLVHKHIILMLSLMNCISHDRQMYFGAPVNKVGTSGKPTRRILIVTNSVRGVFCGGTMFETTFFCFCISVASVQTGHQLQVYRQANVASAANRECYSGCVRLPSVHCAQFRGTDYWCAYSLPSHPPSLIIFLAGNGHHL